MSGADVGPRLRDAAGAPRYEVPVEALYGRAMRARRRNLAVAGGAAGLLVVVVAVLVALLPANDPAPVIGPGPERDEQDAPSDEPDTLTPEPTDEGTDGDATEADAAPLDAADWVVGDINGLRDDQGQPIWSSDGVPAPSTARDGDGGVVFTDAEGLWWWPATATEPELVRAGAVGRVVEVTTADGGPIARTTDAGDLRLADGTQAEADLGALPEATPEGAAITAANGLTAEVVGPEVERTPEGMIEQVRSPATLVISRDGQPELEVAVGTEYEPLARLHDFDGRRVLLSRFPEEPAMAPETVVALDLDCADCVATLATSSPAGASLIGTDVAWDGPVQAPQQDLVTPMTTDEDVQALPDGRHLLVDLAPEDDDSRLSGDLTIWFSTPVATLAAREDGQDVAGDYHLRNRDPARLPFEVAEDVTVTSAWYHDGPGPNRGISYAQLLAALAGDHEGEVRDHLRTGLWWVTVEDGRAVRLDEQYVP